MIKSIIIKKYIKNLVIINPILNNKLPITNKKKFINIK